MKIIQYGKGNTFLVTDDEFKEVLKAWNDKETLYIERLGVSLPPSHQPCGNLYGLNRFTAVYRDDFFCKVWGEYAPGKYLRLAVYPTESGGIEWEWEDVIPVGSALKLVPVDDAIRAGHLKSLKFPV